MDSEFHPSRLALLSLGGAVTDPAASSQAAIEWLGDAGGVSEKTASQSGSLLAPRQSFAYWINSTNSNAKAAAPSVQVIFVDLFDSPASAVTSLKMSGKRVICYFSAGSAENWRPDYQSFSAAVKGNQLDGWAGEKWLDYRAASVRSVMRARIRLAAQKGCQGVDPDNIDGHLNDSGFSLKARDQASYLSFLSAEAKAVGLLIGMKNSAESAKQLEPLADFAVVEECFKYNECGSYSAFANHGKPIFQLEYSKASQSLCDRAAHQGGSLIFANLQLTRFTICR